MQCVENRTSELCPLCTVSTCYKKASSADAKWTKLHTHAKKKLAKVTVHNDYIQFFRWDVEAKACSKIFSKKYMHEHIFIPASTTWQ